MKRHRTKKHGQRPRPAERPRRSVETVAPDTRFITLKSEHLPIDGVPDLLTTRALCFGLAALFLVVAVGLPASFALSPPADLDPVVPILLLICSALAMVLVFIFTRTGLRAGAWFSVDASGLHYGDGRVGRRDEGEGTSIAWDSIVHNAEAAYDVHLIWITPHRGLPVARIGFWVRASGGGLVEGSIPMALIANRLSCARFLNADAVRVSLLRGMATRPALRFHPDVFVQAGIDPETWRPMDRPAGGKLVGAGILAAGGLGVGAFLTGQAPSVLIAIGAVAVFGVCLFAAVSIRGRPNPDLTRIIRFRIEDPIGLST